MKHEAMKILFLTIIGALTTIKASAQTAANPCPCCAAEFRQFDFWVGNWETYQPDGKLAGRNLIVFVQDSCVIQENWTSAAPGYTGTSYNFYNPQTGKWHQTWVDNQGGSLLLSGNLEKENMVLWSDVMKDQKGTPYRNRITWTPNADGAVRQYWEITKDDGKTWTGIFDGLYKKVPTK